MLRKLIRLIVAAPFALRSTSRACRHHHKWQSRLLLLTMALGYSLLSSACFLKLLVYSVGVRVEEPPPYTIPEDGYVPPALGDAEGTTRSAQLGSDIYVVTLTAGSLIATCYEEEVAYDKGLTGAIMTYKMQCNYVFLDEDGVQVLATTSLNLLQNYGLDGLFLDPLIVQVPESVLGASGTVRSGSATHELRVTEVRSFHAGPRFEVKAEAGTKFLIVELPDAVADAVGKTEDGLPLDFQMELTSSELPMAVKTMFTVRVDTPTAAYYLPTLPCTVDFAEIPAITIALQPTLTPRSAMDEVLALAAAYREGACDGTVYDLRTSREERLLVPGLTANR